MYKTECMDAEEGGTLHFAAMATSDARTAMLTGRAHTRIRSLTQWR